MSDNKFVSKIKLEQYYKGDKNWIKHSNCFSEHWIDSDFQIKLLGYLDNRIDLAQVIFYHHKKNSISWLNSKVPALDNLTPLDCLNDEILTNRLKVCLMRSPI